MPGEKPTTKRLQEKAADDAGEAEGHLVKLPKGTLATWRSAAKAEGLTVAEMVRRAVAERVARKP
jgi:hypothetical protein